MTDTAPIASAPLVADVVTMSRTTVLVFQATIDACSESEEHEPHLRLSIPWRDSNLLQHYLYCLGHYDQQRQTSHVSVEATTVESFGVQGVTDPDSDEANGLVIESETVRVLDERPCDFGCTDPGHPKRRLSR